MLQKKLSISIILLTLALALLVSACQGAQAAPTEVTFTARDNSFSGPDSISAGWTQLRLVNEGPDFYHIQLVKLNEGKTVEELVTALKENPVRPHWAELYGGPNPPMPGQSSEAIINLEPGQYALIDTVPDKTGTPHVHYGMAQALTVTSTKSEVSEPVADVTMGMFDFSYSLSQPLTAGKQTIRVNNNGQQPHEVFLARLAPGKSVNDLLASLAPDAPADAIDWQALGGISVIEAGAHAYFSVDLEPGRYALVCFAPENHTGKPHFMLGMSQEITVQ